MSKLVAKLKDEKSNLKAKLKKQKSENKSLQIKNQILHAKMHNYTAATRKL